MQQQAAENRICIIGAGLTGLVAGYRLASAGCEVVLLESTLEPGGMIASFSLGETRAEYIYHHMFTSDSTLANLLGELGLADRLHWYRSEEALFSGQKLFRFSTPLDLLKYRAIPFRQRLRTGLTVLKAGRLTDYLPLEDQTASQWLVSQNGAQAFQKLWAPLLRAKFDRDADDVSAVWIWNKFRLRGGSRSRGGGSRLGYLEGSFGQLADALVGAILQKGGRILYGHTATNISRVAAKAGSSYKITCVLDNSSSVRIAANAVLVTLSGRQFASISAGLSLPDDYLARLRAIRYKGDLCLVLRLARRLSPYYWTTVCDEAPFVVVVEHTNLTGPERYHGHVVYLSRYIDVADPLWTRSDGEIFQLFVEGLSRLYPDFSPGDVIDWRLRRTRYAQPVIGRHYSQMMPGIDTPEAGVKLAGMAQIYPEDRGMNYAVRLGESAARSLLAYRRGEPPC
jgi:protoporphyrinogen oxidase